MDSNWFMLRCSEVCVAFRQRSLCESERHTQRWVDSWVHRFKQNASHSRFVGMCCWVPRYSPRYIPSLHQTALQIDLLFRQPLLADYSPIFLSLHVLLLLLLLFSLKSCISCLWSCTKHHSVVKNAKSQQKRESSMVGWKLNDPAMANQLCSYFPSWIYLPLLNQTEASGRLEGHQSKMLYLLASNMKVFTVNGLKHAELQKRPRKEGLANHWNIRRSCFRCAKGLHMKRWPLQWTTFQASFFCRLSKSWCSSFSSPNCRQATNISVRLTSS